MFPSVQWHELVIPNCRVITTNECVNAYKLEEVYSIVTIQQVSDFIKKGSNTNKNTRESLGIHQ